MKKILLFLLFSTALFSQVMDIEKTLIVKNDIYKILESKLNIIESINGKTWVCYPKEDLVITGGSVVLIDGFPVIHSGNEKSLTLPDKKLDLVQLDFKAKKKSIIKGGSYTSILGYPEKAKEKVEEKLKEKKEK